MPVFKVRLLLDIGIYLYLEDIGHDESVIFTSQTLYSLLSCAL